MAQDNLKILVGAVAGAMLLLIVLVLGKIYSLICHLEGKIDLFKAQISFFYFLFQNAFFKMPFI